MDYIPMAHAILYGRACPNIMFGILVHNVESNERNKHRNHKLSQKADGLV